MLYAFLEKYTPHILTNYEHKVKSVFNFVSKYEQMFDKTIDKRTKVW